MTIKWGVFLTPEFLIGVVVVGLLVNVVAAYLMRSLDWLAKVLPASFRRAQEAESARIKQLTDAATSDHAIYAALAAEASRLRSHQLRQFFVSFVCFSTLVLLLLMASSELKRGIGDPEMSALAPVLGVTGVLLTIFLIAVGMYQYSFGLDSGRRAARLDAALREVQRNLKLPVMD